jgi:hypothetical protein
MVLCQSVIVALNQVRLYANISVVLVKFESLVKPRVTRLSNNPGKYLGMRGDIGNVGESELHAEKVNHS